MRNFAVVIGLTLSAVSCNPKDDGKPYRFTFKQLDDNGLSIGNEFKVNSGTFSYAEAEKKCREDLKQRCNKDGPYWDVRIEFSCSWNDGEFSGGKMTTCSQVLEQIQKN